MTPSQHVTVETRSGDEREPVPALVASVVSALILTVAFGALALGFSWFWVAFPVGFGGVLPLAVGAARYWTESAAGGDEVETGDTPLARARAQYVRGDLSEREFERRVETVLEAETGVQGADAT